VSIDEPTAVSPVSAALVLAGGRGRRLGGVDKARLTLGGGTLLDRAIRTATEATGGGAVVVVGPPAAHAGSWPGTVVRTREDPPGGGPLAGLAAGLAALAATGEPARSHPDAPVLLLAVDMPRVTARTVARLAERLTASGADAAVLVDGDGREQPLAAVYREGALRRVVPDPQRAAGQPLHRHLAALSRVQVRTEGDEARDVDTWQDLADLGGQPPPGAAVPGAPDT
jgi:molybdopterin-guanine dinucleotide biosynthesis protein A